MTRAPSPHPTSHEKHVSISTNEISFVWPDQNLKLRNQICIRISLIVYSSLGLGFAFFFFKTMEGTTTLWRRGATRAVLGSTRGGVGATRPRWGGAAPTTRRRRRRTSRQGQRSGDVFGEVRRRYYMRGGGCPHCHAWP